MSIVINSKSKMSRDLWCLRSWTLEDWSRPIEYKSRPENRRCIVSVEFATHIAHRCRPCD
jgi:hypothetical protein